MAKHIKVNGEHVGDMHSRHYVLSVPDNRQWRIYNGHWLMAIRLEASIKNLLHQKKNNGMLSIR